MKFQIKTLNGKLWKSKLNVLYYVIILYTHTPRSELLVLLVNVIKEGCENNCALLILLIFYLTKSQKSKLSLENKN